MSLWEEFGVASAAGRVTSDSGRDPRRLRARYGPWAVVTGASSGVDVLASVPGPTDSGFAERAGMRMGTALKPVDVAQATLDALGRRSTVLPGALSKLLAYSLAPLPRWARVRIMGRVMGGMTEHRHKSGDLGRGSG